MCIAAGKANLFIVGAAKAGTSTLHSALAGHSDICMSSQKEPNFFSATQVLELSSSMGYQFDVTHTEVEYLKLFDSRDCTYRGEASVSYLSYSSVAQDIYDYNPNAKIIIMLRDPVKRAISHYNMDKRLGICSLELEEVLTHPDSFRPHYFQYVSAGKYFSQIAEYTRVFERENVLFIEFEDIRSSLSQVMLTVYDFLGVEPLETEYVKENVGLVANNGLVSSLYKRKAVRTLIKKILPTSAIGAIQDRFFAVGGDKEIKRGLQDALFELFSDDIGKVEQILGWDLQHWKNPYCSVQ